MLHRQQSNGDNYNTTGQRWPSSRKRRGNVLQSIATALFCFYLLTQEAEKMMALAMVFPPELAGLGQTFQAGEPIIPINGLGLWGLGLIGLAVVLAIRELVRAMREVADGKRD